MKKNIYRENIKEFRNNKLLEGQKLTYKEAQQEYKLINKNFRKCKLDKIANLKMELQKLYEDCQNIKNDQLLKKKNAKKSLNTNYETYLNVLHNIEPIYHTKAIAERGQEVKLYNQKGKELNNRKKQEKINDLRILHDNWKRSDYEDSLTKTPEDYIKNIVSKLLNSKKYKFNYFIKKYNYKQLRGSERLKLYKKILQKYNINMLPYEAFYYPHVILDLNINPKDFYKYFGRMSDSEIIELRKNK